MYTKQIRTTAATVHHYDDGIQILFSYKTPVAMHNPATGETWKTEKYYSNTTSRHVGEFVRQFSGEVKQVSPEKIAAMTEPSNIARAQELAEELTALGHTVELEFLKNEKL